VSDGIRTRDRRDHNPANPVWQTEPVRAVTARRDLSCSEMDLAGLTSLRDRWFDSPRS
jgi:hypothetical protein